MRAVVQRVVNSKVEVSGSSVGEIGKGLLVLLGVDEADNDEDVDWMCKKLTNMRIFQDKDARMNLSVKDLKGEILVVSQFTLHASIKKGNRPSFTRSANAEKARKLYEMVIAELGHILGRKVESGKFGADMKVSLINDGPVTIVLDSKNKE